MADYFVESDRVQYNEKTNSILASYDYQTSAVERQSDGRLKVTPVNHSLTFKTDSRVPRVGCMLIGWGGNNGSTITACVLANKLGLSWRTKEGVQVRHRVKYRRDLVNQCKVGCLCLRQHSNHYSYHAIS